VRVHVTDGSTDAVAAEFSRVVTSASARRARSSFVALLTEDEQSLEQCLGSRVRFEKLALEEIFLELHS
jgi:hypothetical protein